MTDWLNNLQSAGKQKPDKVKPKPVYITVRNPRGDDLGEIREGYYGELPDGGVTLCDHLGTPEGRAEYVGTNETPLQAAGRLLRELYEAEGGGDFNRPLHYSKSRVPC